MDRNHIWMTIQNTKTGEIVRLEGEAEEVHTQIEAYEDDPNWVITGTSF